MIVVQSFLITSYLKGRWLSEKSADAITTYNVVGWWLVFVLWRFLFGPAGLSVR
jgi:hypothetical protein